MDRSFKRLVADAGLAAIITLAAAGMSLGQTESAAPLPPGAASFLDQVGADNSVPPPPSAANLAPPPASLQAPAAATCAAGGSCSAGGCSALASCGSASQGVMSGCGTSCNAEGFCSRHLVADAEMVWLAPCNNQRAGAYEVFNGAAPVEQFTTTTATEEGLVATPRLTLGLQGECWGAQIRYWRMEETRNMNGTDFPTGIGSVAEGGFFAETLDLEGTRKLCLFGGPALATFGVRYGQFEQSAGLFANDIIGGNFYSGSVLSGVQFSGVGLTSSISGLHPWGNSNFNLFYNFRGSILWDGSAGNFVQARADFQSVPDVWAKDYEFARSGGDGNMFIGEAQVGGQWNWALRCMPADAFLRVAFEYQYWAVNDTGSATAVATAGSGPLGTGVVGVAAGHSSDAFVNLVGFSVGTGITW